jgi:HD-GYP domain-containing protein (c-di-GMP phosphodiesterase class II)
MGIAFSIHLRFPRGSLSLEQHSEHQLPSSDCCSERIDGTGWPRQLRGDAILPAAKVVAVAKRLVDLIQGQEGAAQGLDASLRTILAEAGGSLDRSSVAALVAFLDNRGGRAKVGLS